jgi:ABC-type sugar transport system ATPase subunit
MVNQHFMLVPPLTVTENIMLGQESTTSGTRALGELTVLDGAPSHGGSAISAANTIF